jgi:hypothetical protein
VRIEDSTFTHLNYQSAPILDADFDRNLVSADNGM